MAVYKTTYKGRYKVQNPSKYRGDCANVIYRSLWELKFMVWCDKNPSVIEWGSETVVIPYVSPLDRKLHRYFVDFYIKVRQKDGATTQYLIEIKPERFTKPPPIPERKTKSFINEVFQFGVNEAKWKSASEFCENRGLKFLILTEKDLRV